MPQAPVTLSEYNPEWPQKFEAEKGFLMEIVGNWLYGSVEHVGSTSVPGLVSKPVIDIMFGVTDLAESLEAVELIEKNGYVYFPYKTDVMHWFCKPSDEFRTHHLHLIPYQSPLWKERILFRDILRSDKAVASAYTDLKSDLAEKHKNDREAYTIKKWPFVKRVLDGHLIS